MVWGKKKRERNNNTFVPRVTSQTIVLECISETMLETGFGGNCFLSFGTILEKQIVEFPLRPVLFVGDAFFLAIY